MKILKIILSTLLILFLCCVTFFTYLGGFKNVEVKKSSFTQTEIIFSTHRGPYKNLSASWTAFQKKWEEAGLKQCQSLAIYLDPPGTPEEQLRSILGCQIDQLSEEEKVQLKKVFPIFTIPSAEVIESTFPYKNPFSFFIGPMKVYPKFHELIQKEQILTPAVAIEIYGLPHEITEIRYLMPVSLNREHFKVLMGQF